MEQIDPRPLTGTKEKSSEEHALPDEALEGAAGGSGFVPQYCPQCGYTAYKSFVYQKCPKCSYQGQLKVGFP